jgi:hypothetical protein
MLGLWGEYARTYLLFLMAATTAVFALPIFLVPLKWARWLGWTIPQQTDLAVYFGRCLGAFILIVELLMLRAAVSGTGLIFTFQVLLAVSAFMIAVHAWGALLRIQPISETLEIGMYSGLALLTILFYPVQG